MPPATRILTGLLAGLVLGAAGARSGLELDRALDVARVVGGLWLDALRMTIVPLVFALVVTGVAAAAAQREAGGLTRRALALFALLLFASAVVGAGLGTLLLDAWIPPDLEGLQGQLSGKTVPPVPPAGEWLRGLVPVNPIGAAAQGAIVPVVLFAVVFGLGAARVDRARSASMLGALRGVVDTMLVIVGWVLLLAPIGVFALAFDAAARIGLGLGVALAWYVAVQIIATIVLALAMYVLAATAGGARLASFARAAAPAQAVAFSTQSSLASLPAMLTATQSLGLPSALTGVVLPLAVALFRIAAPASIVIVTLTLAQLNGVEVGIAQIGVIVALATLNTLVIAGLPNQITFFAAYAPPAIAVGVPIELLPLLLAIDTVPDMFYTVSNVTADLSTTAVIGRQREG